MPADDGWTTVTSSDAAASAISASRAGRPQLSIIDILLMLWRGKWIVILVAIPFVAAALALALTMPKEYEALSRIQVTAGSERVFDPIVGGLQATVLSQEEITESEIELLRSPVIADRVIQKLGLEVIYPKMHEAMQKAPVADRPLIYEEAVAALQKNFYAGAAPKNPVIRTVYKNENPVVAADVLNTFIKTYLEYRAEVFAKDDTGFLSTQRKAANKKLADADKAIEKFMVTNRVGDFDTEKKSVAALYSSVEDELLKVKARISEVDGALSTTRTQISMTEPTIDLNRETIHNQELFALRFRREQMLATYQPGTPQVQALDRQIEKIEKLIAEQGQTGARIQRGPNELYQQLETRRTSLESEASALAERFDELNRQKLDLEKRQLQLTRLEPRYQELLLDRSIQVEQVRTLTIREEEERLKRESARADFENIQILEPARIPAKGKSKRKLVIAAGVIFGLGTGLMFALLWIFTRSTLPTASSVARTSGLPVLASVRPV